MCPGQWLSAFDTGFSMISLLKKMSVILPLVTAVLRVSGFAYAQPVADLGTAVKATYLYKFAPFVTWPSAPGDNLVICVVGKDPFGDVLDKAVAGQSYNNSPFRIIRLTTIETNDSCAVAYLGGSRKQSVAAALKSLKGHPVLTVTDNSQPGGMIDFVTLQDHIRFRVDLAAASESHLDISSKLLAMAASVRSVSDTKDRP